MEALLISSNPNTNSQFNSQVESLANALGLDLQLEEIQAEGSVRAGESEQRGVDLDIGGSSSGEQQQQKVVEQQQEEELVQQQEVVEQEEEEEVVEQADGLNSFARQLEEQLSSCHREKPFGNHALHPELVGDNEELVGDNKMELVDENAMALDLQQTEELLERKELLGGNPCQECTAVLPSGLLCSFRFNIVKKHCKV